ncbi:MAG TPA: FAD-binding oxidoreductase [Abditibacteriaceae bacterium]
MTSFVSRELEGWGRFPTQTCRVARPEKRRAVGTAALNNDVPNIIARGLGRAYGDAALNENSGVLLNEKLGRFLHFDEQSGILHAEAGASFADILQTFVPRGWFLPVVPGTKFVTLGGAIACDVHGKNHHRDGCLSNFIEEVELLTANGQTRRLTKESPDEFWATAGGTGLTGVILSAKVRLVPIESAQIATTYTRTQNLDETLAAFGTDDRFQYSVAWIDCLASGANLGRSVLIRGNHANKNELKSDNPLEFSEPRGKKVPLDFPDGALNPLSVKAFNALYYAAHPDAQKLVGFEPFFWPLDAVSGWNKIYGARGFIQYQCVLPFETSHRGLVKLLETISQSGQASFLAVLKTFGPSTPSPLGFPLPGHTLALDIPAGENIVEFARALDAIVIDHGGRVYLAKDATLEATTFRKMYPRHAEFEAVKLSLDPQNRFQSSLSRRLQIGGGN